MFDEVRLREALQLQRKSYQLLRWAWMLDEETF